MKFIVNRLNADNLEHEFDQAQLANVVTTFWKQGLSEKMTASMDVKTMQTKLDEIFALHKGQESFKANKNGFFEGMYLGLSFKGTWNDDKFTISEVELNEARYLMAYGKGDAKEQRTRADTSAAFKALTQSYTSKAKEQAAVAAKGVVKGASYLLNVVPHAVVAGVAYLGRNVLIDGAKAVAARVGLALPAAVLTPVAAVSSMVGLSLAADAIRRWLKKSNESTYAAKTSKEWKNLNQDHFHAFKDGVEAQKSYAAQAKTCFSFNDYRHANAFYAGMSAESNHNQKLIDKVERRIEKPKA